VVPKALHDFGRVAAARTLRHEFTIHNRGTSRLVLNRNTCGGCEADSSPPHIILAPGEETPIAVTLHTEGQRDPRRRVATVTTRDPYRPRIDSTVTADITKGGEQSDKTASDRLQPGDGRGM